MSKREALARALCAAHRGHPCDFPECGCQWMLVGSPLKEVDAVLAELREPDEGICAQIRGDALQPIWDKLIGEFVQKYIDAITTEPPK